MATLAVNVDHVATVRQARLITEPDPVTAALLAEQAGCHGIIVHLREDRRHIQDRDVEKLRQTLKTRLNLEMAAVDENKLKLGNVDELLTYIKSYNFDDGDRVISAVEHTFEQNRND